VPAVEPELQQRCCSSVAALECSRVPAVELEGVLESFCCFELKGRMTLLYCIINSFSVGCSFIKGLCLGRSTHS